MTSLSLDKHFSGGNYFHFFPLEIIQKFQHCLLCALRENIRDRTLHR